MFSHSSLDFIIKNSFVINSSFHIPSKRSDKNFFFFFFFCEFLWIIYWLIMWAIDLCKGLLRSSVMEMPGNDSLKEESKGENMLGISAWLNTYRICSGCRANGLIIHRTECIFATRQAWNSDNRTQQMGWQDERQAADVLSIWWECSSTMMSVPA